MVTGFFPLDEHLGLLPGQLTPQLQGWLIRLAVWLPFAQAASLFAEFTGTPVSTATAQRLTTKAGTTALHTQQQDTAALIQTLPLPVVTPDQQVLSVDGAMVPLRGGEWGEVKTLAIGELRTRTLRDGRVVPQTEAISYFSRLCDAGSFIEAARWEIHRRGVERAGRVIAVNDGAEWIQGFVDHHCPSAVRILDFAHASQRLTTISEACFGVGSPQGQQWQREQRSVLKAQGGTAVLAAIAVLQARLPDPRVIAEDVAYLAKREALLAYDRFEADGWPIGSGMVESANKLVVEARMKGSGMHWERANVNGMLALRNAVCNDRWMEQWGVIGQVWAGEASGARRRRGQSSRRTRRAPRSDPVPVRSEKQQSAAEAITQVQAELANERANSVWRKPWSRRRQRELGNAKVLH